MVHASRQSDLTVLVFELDGNRFGLEAKDVLEVVRAVQPTRLLQAPDVVEGVINVRGRVAALLDLRARFGMTRRPISANDVILLCEVGKRLIGLRADRTVNLTAVSASDLATVDEVGPSALRARGAVLLPDGLFMLCDLNAFLSEAEQLALTTALQSSGFHQGVAT